MLLDLWEAALRAEVGIGIPTDNRALLRQHLYRARAEAKDPRFDKLTLLMPERPDEVWLVHRDADTRGADNQSDFEPLD